MTCQCGRSWASRVGWTRTNGTLRRRQIHRGSSTLRRLKLMMQKLFAERFGLQVHEEKRKMAAFVLSVSKDGPKMTKITDASLAPGQMLYPRA